MLTSHLQRQGPPLPFWQGALQLRRGARGCFHEARPSPTSRALREHLRFLMKVGCSVTSPHPKRGPNFKGCRCCCVPWCTCTHWPWWDGPWPHSRSQHTGSSPSLSSPVSYPACDLPSSHLPQICGWTRFSQFCVQLQLVCHLPRQPKCSRCSAVKTCPGKPGPTASPSTKFCFPPGKLGDRNCSLGFGIDLTIYATSDSSMHFLIYDPVFWLSRFGS